MSDLECKTGIKQRILNEIAAIAQRHNVEKVILFGSRARSDFKRASDIDLAVEGGDFVRFSVDLEEETSTLLEYDVLDLSRDMQHELREAIEKEGVIIYEKV